MRPFRNVDDTLGVIYTHGFAGLAGGLLLGFFADPNIIVYAATGGGATDLPGIAGIFNGGNAELFKDELVTGLWVIGFSAVGTFILLKLVGLFVPLRMERGGHGGRRHRRARARGLPLGRAVAGVSVRGQAG